MFHECPEPHGSGHEVRESAVVPYQNYQLLEAERSKTLSDLRAADVQRGEFAAAISRSFRAAGRAIVRVVPGSHLHVVGF
jgi:hypothetical protein